MQHYYKDLVGQKFGRLTVIKYVYTKSKRAYWECVCDCGNIVTKASSDLISGNTKSCGCYKIDKFKERTVTHGMSTTRQHSIWRGMIQRCTNPKRICYNGYGGRGITVCDKWLKFEGFWEDMKDGYSDELTIDRINNDKGYYKDNCRWATKEEQANNMSTNVIYSYNGKSLNISQWAKETGISYFTLYKRLRKRNLTIEEAINFKAS